MTATSIPRSDHAARRGIRLAALRVPLAVKLLGANAGVVAIVLLAWRITGADSHEAAGAVIALAIAVHGALVMFALRPIRELEAVATRVWQGDYGARVDRSRVADDHVVRVGSMFNILLDDLASDRARLRALARELITTGDRERAAIARELHDSTAQHVAALLFQLSGAARDAEDDKLAEQLRGARDSAASILEQVRMLSQTVYPGVLDDLGIEAALRTLVRESTVGNAIDFDVKVDASLARLPALLERVLYRVAQEAIRNAVRHASASRVRVSLRDQGPVAVLDVHDDGRGFDLAPAEQRRRTGGLCTMRERVGLVDGWVEINTAPGDGTTVSATVPLDEQMNSIH